MDHIWIMNMDHVDHEYGSIIFLIKKNPFMRSYPAKHVEVVVAAAHFHAQIKCKTTKILLAS